MENYSTPLRIIRFLFCSLSLSCFYPLGKLHFVSAYQILSYSSFLQYLAPTLQTNISNFSHPPDLSSLRKKKLPTSQSPASWNQTTILISTSKNINTTDHVWGTLMHGIAAPYATQDALGSISRNPHNWLPKHQVSMDGSAAL